jgi:hypothetical protein
VASEIEVGDHVCRSRHVHGNGKAVLGKGRRTQSVDVG